MYYHRKVYNHYLASDTVKTPATYLYLARIHILGDEMPARSLLRPIKPTIVGLAEITPRRSDEVAEKLVWWIRKHRGQFRKAAKKR
jgi:hypothetical protein